MSLITITNDVECIAYGEVTSTGTFTDDLTYLRRGLYGTFPASHASGQEFTRFDLARASPPVNSMLVYDLPAQYVGQTVYLKFASFNRFASGLQSLADVDTYQYTPLGTGFGGGSSGLPTAPSGIGVASGFGAVVLSWAANPSTDAVTEYEIYAAPGADQPFSDTVEIGQSTSTSFTASGLTPGDTYTFYVVAVNTIGTSSVSTGINGTAGQIASGQVPAIRYDIDAMLYGTQSVASQVIRRYTAPRAVTIPTSGNVANADVASTGTAVFTIKKNGTSVGTVTFTASATGVFSISSAVTLAINDVLEIIGPAMPDSALSMANFILAASA